MNQSATAAAWFSTFLEKALVKRVKRRMLILMDRFCRSTKDVLTCFGLGSASHAVHVHVSPQPSAFFSGVAFFAFAPTKFQISSHCKRRTRRLRTWRS